MTIRNHTMRNHENKVSVWSVDRIGRLIVGVLNVILVIAVLKISSYFLIGLCLVNLNLIFTSLTDQCPMRNFLMRLGAKERESFFNANGDLIKSNHSKQLLTEFSETKKMEV